MISYSDLKAKLHEVAPPGWGHTKAEKEKTKPDKPKSKIGGSAAAFKRALDDGRFKGLPGDTTKKEKTASMFKLMWSMKKKGDKPHYKPGTDKKYKKYQEENELSELTTKEVKKLDKASALAQSDDPKKQDRARARRTEIDYNDLMRQLGKKKKKVNESDQAYKNVVARLKKQHGDGVLASKKDFDDHKKREAAKPKPKPKAQKPLTDAEKNQREVDARYGRTPWNKKGSLGT